VPTPPGPRPPGLPADPETALRRCALAAAVLHDVDLEPTAHGVRLPGEPAIRVSWAECRRAVAGADPESDPARRRLASWLRMRRWIAERPLEDVVERARPVGMAVHSEVHPGLDWVRLRVLGDALDVGLGFVGLDPAHPEALAVPPQRLLEAAGVLADDWWPTRVVYLEEMGRLAAERYQAHPELPLRPMGDCDVVTLLASRTLRRALTRGHAGMRSAAVPVRSRGWLDPARVDPAYVQAVAALTEPARRGFDRAVLLTAEEVALAPTAERPAEIALRDPAAPRPWFGDVLYHR
jgi:hypothetical protein